MRVDDEFDNPPLEWKKQKLGIGVQKHVPG